jgi:transposase
MMKTKQLPSAQTGNPAVKVQNLHDFRGRELFAGIDVHKARWQVAAYYEGLILSNTSIEGNSEALIIHLRKRYGEAHFNCVYESAPFSFALFRSLWAAGMECMVVNPADLPSADKDRRSKTYQVDARKLSMHLASGLLHAIHVPTEKLQKQRSLIRFCKKL